MDSFRGTIEQIPPMYSALKQDGQPLYKLARQGKTVERKSRTVQVHRLELVSFATPIFCIDVTCSKGTYIRTLAEDMGLALGCGAHITALRRTAVGTFGIAESRSLESIEQISESERDSILLPLDTLVDSWAKAELPATAAARFRHGEAVQLSWTCAGHEACKTAVYDEAGVFMGLGSVDSSGLLKPQRLLKTG